jgi:hypothetical protein
VIHHFVKNMRPVPTDYRHARQIDHQLASPERIRGAPPSSVEFRGPGFHNSARENELSLNFGFDRRDLQHCSSAAAKPKATGMPNMLKLQVVEFRENQKDWPRTVEGVDESVDT